MEKIFFDSIESVVRICIIGVLAYVGIIILLRTSGKRTLSKMNAFDFIVTIALGSTLATVLLDKSIPLFDGVLAFAILIYLQYMITYLSVRYKTINNLLKSTPTLLVYKGKLLPEMMKKERIDEDEIYATIRKKGLSSVEQVDVMILESDGSLSLVQNVADMHTRVLSKINITTHDL
jgi:uncharacterized membrane protein YcaP (DUF421 family)